MNNPTISKITPKAIYKSKLIVRANSDQITPSISIMKNEDYTNPSLTLSSTNNSYSSLQFHQPFVDSNLNKAFNHSVYSNSATNTRQHLKKTLILDLDETLIHSTQEMIPNQTPNHTLSISFDPDLPNQKIYVYSRPHLNHFLERMAQKYELMIFTASQPSYANLIIDLIDKNKLISMRFYRNNCRQRKTCFLKDLSIINRDLRRVIIVDNNPKAYSLHNDNGIPIDTWICDKNDNELNKLSGLLEFLNETHDVRNYIRLLVDKSYVDYSKLKMFQEMIRAKTEQSKEIEGNEMTNNQNNQRNILHKDESQATNNDNKTNKSKSLQLNRMKNDKQSGAFNYYINVRAVLIGKINNPSPVVVNLPLMNRIKSNTSIQQKGEFSYRKDDGVLPIVKRCINKFVPNKNLFNYKIRKYTDKGLILNTEYNCVNTRMI